MLKWHVKELIEARGLNVRPLARQAHVFPRTIQKICQDPFYYGKITTRTWERLATALEVGIFEILRDEPDDEKPQG
jgi:DNA-binding Xre family transcriptional regulator